MPLDPSGVVLTPKTDSRVQSILEKGHYLYYDVHAWSGESSYLPDVVVRHNSVNYLSINSIPANTQALTEPGVGTAWKDYWIVLGRQENNPNAFTGVTPSEGSLTFTREGGQHPVEVSIPAFSPPDTGLVRFAPVFSGTVTAPARSDTAGVRIGSGDEAIIEDSDNVTYLILGNAPTSGHFTWVITGSELRDTQTKATGLTASDPISFVGFSLWTNNSGHLLVSGSASIANLTIKVLKLVGGIGPSSVTPSITHFEVTGKQQVQPGTDIGGQSYSYKTQIAQSAHVEAIRIIGYSGSIVHNPTTVAVLTTINATDFAHATGLLSIPSNTVLANEGDAYNIRLEVYAEGLTPGTDPPTTYQDYSITAVISSQVHFGYIRAGSSLSGLVFNDNDIEAREEVSGLWTNLGVPEDSNDYINYIAVPETLAQPVDFTSASLLANASWKEAQQATFDEVPYLVYLNQNHIAARGAEMNGLSWGVSI